MTIKYNDFLDEIALPEQELLEYVPGQTSIPHAKEDLLYEVNKEITANAFAVEDLNKPAFAAQLAEEQSETYTH